MITFEEAINIIEEDVKAAPYQFVLTRETPECWLLQAKLWRPDTYTGVMGWGYSGERVIRCTTSVRNLVMSCYAVAESFAVHELREAFEYKGEKIVGPHIPLEAMWEAAGWEREHI